MYEHCTRIIYKKRKKRNCLSCRFLRKDEKSGTNITRLSPQSGGSVHMEQICHMNRVIFCKRLADKRHNM